MLATCTLRLSSRKSATSRSLIRTASRPPTSGPFARVAGEHVRAGVDRDRGVVDGGRGLAEADGDQPDLAGVLRVVAGREDPLEAGPHRGVDDDVPLGHLDPPLLERAEVGHEAERGDDRLGREGQLLAVGDDVHALDDAVAPERGDLGLGEDPDRRRAHLLDRAGVGAERVAPVHQGHRPGDRLEVERPVEGAVAAADDHHVLAGVRREARHEELEATTEPAVAGRQRPRAELADPGGDQDRPGPDLRAVFEADGDAVPVVAQAGRGPVEEVLRVRRAGLGDQPLDEVATLDRREARHVEDLLLGVHRGDLAAELGQRVDHRDPQPAEPGVVRREQPGGSRADDKEVGVERHGSDPPPELTGTCSSLSETAAAGYCVSRSETSQPCSVCTTVTSARYGVAVVFSPFFWTYWFRKSSACTWVEDARTTPAAATFTVRTVLSATNLPRMSPTVWRYSWAKESVILLVAWVTWSS